MATDYLKKKQEAEQGLNDFLNSRQGQISSNIDQTKSNIDSSQSSFLGGLNLNPAAIQPKLDKLKRKNNLALSKQKYSQNTARMQLIFDNALKMAQEAGYDYQSAVEFARQKANQAQSEDFAAREAEKNRQQQMTGANIQDQYAQRGIALKDQYLPSLDYGSALARIAANVGTSYVTAKSLYGKPNTSDSQKFAGVNGYGVPGDNLTRSTTRNFAGLEDY